MIFSKAWWKAALIRAGKTAAQSALAIIPAAATIAQVNWVTVLGTAALAALVSVLMSLGGLPELTGEKRSWWAASGIRAIKTMCQTAVGMIPAGITIQEVSWISILGVSALAAIISILTSVAGLPEAEDIQD